MDYWVFININITSALGFSIVERKLRKKKTMITRSFSCVLVCLRWRILWSRHMKRRLTRHLGGIAGYFCFILRVLLDMECYEWIRFASEKFLYSEWCVITVISCWCWIKLSKSCSNWLSVIGLGVSSMDIICSRSMLRRTDWTFVQCSGLVSDTGQG